MNIWCAIMDGTKVSRVCSIPSSDNPGKVLGTENYRLLTEEQYEIYKNRPSGHETFASDAGLSFSERLISDSEAFGDLRIQRDQLLADSDKYVLPDYPIDEVVRGKVLAYRQALRDLPKNTKDPRNPVWPIMEFVIEGKEEQ